MFFLIYYGDLLSFYVMLIVNFVICAAAVSARTLLEKRYLELLLVQ